MKIYLRPVKKEDGKLIVKWRNSALVRNHCFDKTPITEESNEAFYEANIVTGKYKQYIVERIEEFTGVASYSIATVYLKDMDYVNHRCELCIFTSDDEEWNTESQSIAIKMLINKAFDEMGIHKIYSYVFSKNEDEKQLLINSGFREEAVLREEAVDEDGEYENVIRLYIINN